MARGGTDAGITQTRGRSLADPCSVGKSRFVLEKQQECSKNEFSKILNLSCPSFRSLSLIVLCNPISSLKGGLRREKKFPAPPFVSSRVCATRAERNYAGTRFDNRQWTDHIKRSKNGDQLDRRRKERKLWHITISGSAPSIMSLPHSRIGKGICAIILGAHF